MYSLQTRHTRMPWSRGGMSCCGHLWLCRVGCPIAGGPWPLYCTHVWGRCSWLQRHPHVPVRHTCIYILLCFHALPFQSDDEISCHNISSLGRRTWCDLKLEKNPLESKGICDPAHSRIHETLRFGLHGISSEAKPQTSTFCHNLARFRHTEMTFSPLTKIVSIDPSDEPTKTTGGSRK
jgi:hypothetical protein